MISTITAATITIVSLAGTLSGVVAIVLIGLLIQKETLRPLINGQTNHLRQTLNIAIVPLALIFIVTVIVKIIEVLAD